MKGNQKTAEEILVEYLDCPYQIFQPMKDDNVLMEAYTKAVEQGKKEGFVPVLVCCGEPENMLETLIWNATEKTSTDTDYDFDIEEVRAFREEMCKKDLPEGKAVLKEWMKQNDDEDDDENDEYEDDDEYDDDDEEYEDDDEEYDDDDEEYEDDDEYEDDEYEDWERECLRQMAEEDDEYDDEYDDEGDNTLSAYTNYDGVNATTTVVLAKIPVTNPWEIFAWVPFGGWNECPDTEDLMAISKYWYETYGAVPAAISHDVLEYMVPEPVKKKDARKLADEQAAFCIDIVSQGVGDVRIIADILTKSTVWYFWWD